MIEVLVLGASGTYPGPNAPTLGHLISRDSTHLWVDAGPGTFQALSAAIAPEDLAAVVISHIHPDHCVDLFALVHYLAYGPPGGSVTIDVYAPAEAKVRFVAFLNAGSDHAIHRVLRFHEPLPGDTVAIGAVDVTFAAARHSIPAFLTRYRSDGRSVVYTGDTGPTDALTDLAARADVLIAEATIGPNEDPWVFHMTASEAGEAAAAAAVGKLVLTHLPPTLDKAQAQALAAKAFGGEVVVAAPGMRLVI